ncbi:MAG TPA: mechanosensitive ion channel domain-containing protein [Saprospiraceae bacterium]|nr:mechanosensitive ion channel domain-containing protein [Saprospiraceae bacterium]
MALPNNISATMESRAMDVLIEYIPKIALSIFALIIGIWLIKQISKVFNRLLFKSQIDETLYPFFSSIVNIGLKLFLFITVAGFLGIQTTSFFAVLASAFFAIGLALQGSLSNLAAGVMIFLFKPFKIGDIVNLSDNTGRVEEILIFNTILMDDSKKIIFIPNSIILNGIVKNNSGRGQYVHKLRIPLKHIYPFTTVKPLMQSSIDSINELNVEKPVDIIIQMMEPKIYWIEISYICEWNLKDSIADSIYNSIQDKLLENSIEIGNPK